MLRILVKLPANGRLTIGSKIRVFAGEGFDLTLAGEYFIELE